jgi:hypothetical protein
VSTLGSVRRYYLAKRHAALDNGDKALELVWEGKQLAEPGEALPTDFPYAARLIALGYVALEDLAGADAEELTDQGFTSRESTEILAAL